MLSERFTGACAGFLVDDLAADLDATPSARRRSRVARRRRGLGGGWLDSDWDAGVDAGIGNLRWSSVHYSWEIDAHPPRSDEWWTRLALAVSVLGRSEFVSLRQATSISGPHVTPDGRFDEPYLGLDASRHNYVDATFGVRVAVWRSVVLSLGASRRSTAQASVPTLEPGRDARRDVLILGAGGARRQPSRRGIS